MRARIQREKFEVDSLTRELDQPKAGATVVFLGKVREFGGEAVEIKTDENMVEQLSELPQKAIKKFNLLDAVVVHREGKLRVKEPISFIGVASGHREDAFKGCEWLIDQVKKLIPLKELK
ncbi:MAG TPA: molybdenum cofactor biosynthesis protein MoaE [Thermoplasmata archaeon]|nr:molybdenum cofactor biosynthesis protein MoaE [Thermoplasmata archaeon]